MAHETLPPGYVALVKRLAALIEKWCATEPGLPDLRWHDPGDTGYIGGLQSELVKFLANSPDAFRLLEWLDVQTNREATILQVTVALRILGHLPPKTGAPPPPEVTKTSAAFKSIERFAFETGTDTRLPEKSPCPSCGMQLDGATGELGHVPRPGDLSVCCYCGAAMLFDDALRLRSITAEEWAALPEEIREQLTEQRDLLRAYKPGAAHLKKGVQA